MLSAIVSEASPDERGKIIEVGGDQEREQGGTKKGGRQGAKSVTWSKRADVPFAAKILSCATRRPPVLTASALHLLALVPSSFVLSSHHHVHPFFAWMMRTSNHSPSTLIIVQSGRPPPGNLSAFSFINAAVAFVRKD